MPSSPRRFIQSKNYFLTFPKCDLGKELCLRSLKALPFALKPLYIRVSEEHHQDGEKHLHCLLQFAGTFTCTNQRFFDLVSPSRSAHFHPKVQGARSASEVQTYISKHGDYIEDGQLQIYPRSARGCRTARDEVYAEALNSGDASEALRIIKEKDPRTYFSQHRKLSRNLEMIFRPPSQAFSSEWDPSSFNVPFELQQWSSDNIVVDPAARPDRPMSIIIEGPNGVGKTAWARSLGTHNYLCGDLDLNARVYNNDMSYNVIDNVTPNKLKLKHWKELLGAKHDWQSNCRYGKHVRIKGGIPTIVLCNPGPKTSFKAFLDKKNNHLLKEWTLLNAFFAFIKEPLFEIHSSEGIAPAVQEAEANQEEEN